MAIYPPHRPAKLSLFLGKIVRNLALYRWKREHAKKRGGGQGALLLEELEDCLPVANSTEQTVDDTELILSIGRFLQNLPARECNLFLARYWYAKTLAEMATLFSIKENAVKASLFRSREKLKEHLEKEGVVL